MEIPRTALDFKKNIWQQSEEEYEMHNNISTVEAIQRQSKVLELFFISIPLYRWNPP